MIPAARNRHYLDQRLLARDLAADASYESRHRALHVRAVHQTWGVALGFELLPAIQVGATTVTVGPGLAYDACGAELLQPGTVGLELPAMETGESRDLVCSGEAGRSRLRWVDPGDPGGVRRGRDIVLGTYFCISLGSFVLHVRSYDRRDQARAAIRPRIATDLVRGADLEWFQVIGQPVVVASVRTGHAGFTTSPHYLLWLLEWPPEAMPPPQASVLWSIQEWALLQLTFLHPYDQGDDGLLARLAAKTLLRWYGIEPTGGLWPRLIETATEEFDD